MIVARRRRWKGERGGASETTPSLPSSTEAQSSVERELSPVFVVSVTLCRAWIAASYRYSVRTRSSRIVRITRLPPTWTLGYNRCRYACSTQHYVFYVLFSLNTNPKYVRWTKTFKRNCVVQNHQPILLFFDKISFSLLLNLTNVETKSSKEIRYGILKSRSLRTPVSILICKRLVLYVVRKYLIYYLNIRHHSSLFQIRFSQKENPNLN